MLEFNPLTTQPIFDHPQALHDSNTGFIHPLIHIYILGRELALFPTRVLPHFQMEINIAH